MNQVTPTPITWTMADTVNEVLREALSRAVSDLERVAEMPPMSRVYEMLNISNRMRNALIETAQ